MKVSKNTISELLDLYLGEKGIYSETREKIKDSLFNGVEKQIKKQEDKYKREKKREKERDKKERKKARVSHGTTCPRIMIDDDLVDEF